MSASEVSSEVVRLIEWRDRAALDWHGEDLVYHIAWSLRNFSPKDVPEDLVDALEEFKALDDEVRLDTITKVVGP